MCSVGSGSPTPAAVAALSPPRDATPAGTQSLAETVPRPWLDQQPPVAETESRPRLSHIPPLAVTPSTVLLPVAEAETAVPSSSDVPPLQSPAPSHVDITNPFVAPPTSHPMQTRSKSGIVKPRQLLSLHTTHVISEPSTFTQASKDLNWQNAMAEEFNALITNNTWQLVPFDDKANLVGCKWVYKIKYNSNGSIERYKARLVAQGFHQQAGIDFHETFSPVVKPTTIRLVLSLAISFGWVIRQLDVKNAFLHGLLTEEVYMKQPPGFVHPQFPTHVCKLNKAIYGLKQAPRAWFHRFSSFILSLGFFCSKTDSSMFVHRRGSDLVILLLYVDDIIITGSSCALIRRFISLLSTQFAMKDLGDIHYFLGIHVSRTSDILFLSQHKYIHDLLEKFHLHNLTPLRTPVASKTYLSLIDGELLADPSVYRSMVGALQYLTITRPDIVFGVHVVSQFMHAPRSTHLLAVKRIYRYLQGTADHGLSLRKATGPTLVVAYSDADWAGCPDSSRSTTGYAVFFGPNLISWRSKKQPTVSKSSTEAEYRALAYTVAETLWIRHLLVELGIVLRHPVTLFCDNIRATYTTATPVLHDRSKHIKVDYHFVRERVAHGDLIVRYVPTHLQLADIFTKGLSSQQFLFLKHNLSVCFPPRPD